MYHILLHLLFKRKYKSGNYFSVYERTNLFGILLQNLNVRTLEPLHVSVVISDDKPAVNVVGHPGKVDQSSEHTLQVDVVTKNDPESKHCLAKT